MGSSIRSQGVGTGVVLPHDPGPRPGGVRRCPVVGLAEAALAAAGAGPAGTPRLVQATSGATARLHNAVMEEVFTALRASAGAAAALDRGPLPARGGVPVFPCSLALTGPAAIANPGQPSHSVNFYEIEPHLDGEPFEPGTPLHPGVWAVTWTCPSYPAAHGGPAAGAFHVGVGVPAAALPPAWATNAAGPVTGAPGNLGLPVLAGGGLTVTLQRLVADRARAERDGCAAMAGLIASKAARVRNQDPTLFDRDDAMQEGMARLVVLMRRFAARGRPRACWSVAAGLVLERDLPRAADRVGHLPSDVAHCAHWLARTDAVDLRDSRLTPGEAAAAYARDQQRHQRARSRTRSWLHGGSGRAPFSAEVWRHALDEARRGRPLSLDAVGQERRTDDHTPVADLAPVVDRDLELVGERTLPELLADLLAGTGLDHEDVGAFVRPRLARRGYPAEVLGGGAAPTRTARDAAEDRLLALVARPGESLRRQRAELRARVRTVLFDEAGRYRPTEERVRLWARHRAAATTAAT